MKIQESYSCCIREGTNAGGVITKKEIEKLTTIVNETVATSHKRNNVKIFSSAQFWDMQRRRKTSAIRRELF